MKVSILGTRGIPAGHGGFETFAERLALYLTKRGHQVTVYCQTKTPPKTAESEWCGVRLISFYAGPGPMGTIRFDWQSVWRASREDGIVLTLGYNTAIFSALYILRGKTGLMNMDGIEWKREKWSPTQRVWLRLNEYLGAKLSKHLIADHPEIEIHLRGLAPASKITMIPYEADQVDTADCSLIERYGLLPGKYAIVIARSEPENSMLEIIRAFTTRKRGIELVVLGRYAPNEVPYHRTVVEAAGPEVRFLGSIYDKDLLAALRRFACFYIHGHRVGGTNPSLVEAMGTGSPVIAHNNRFTRWVAGPGQEFFNNEEDLRVIFDRLLAEPTRLQEMAEHSRQRYLENFTSELVLTRYEQLLLRFA